jgi:hypothetical protein
MSDEVTAPDPPELAPARALLDRGDYRGALALLRPLAKAPPSPEIERAANALLAQLAPDPRALVVGLGAVALLLGMVIHYVL